MDETQGSRLKALIQKNRLAFSMGQNDLGQLAYFRYCLPLVDETKCAYQTQRPVPLPLVEKVDREIESWTNLGMIKPSQSGFNIPILVLKKGDGSIRISLDARKLNTLLVPDRFPLPHLTTLFTQIGEKLSAGKKCYVSTFDWFRGYWAVKVDECDQPKLAFSYKNKHMQSTRMLYGCSTAPAAFSRIMQKLFGDHPSILIYLDDLVIIDNNFESHMKSIEFLFAQCQKYGILLSPKKCHFCADKIEFLGHVFDAEGIKPLQKHIELINNFPEPETKAEMKRFIGMVNFQLKFIPLGSVIMGPLYKSCSSKRDFYWGPEQENAFKIIKAELLKSPGLKHRNPLLPLILVNDSAKFRTGSVLYQVALDGKLETIGYSSSRLSDPDSRRPMRVKELIAVVNGIRAFEYYLTGAQFKVVSDHKSLMYLFREHLSTELDVKLVNIFHYLQRFTFEILHRSGNDELLATADCLSRLPVTTFQDMKEKITSENIPDHIFSIIHTPETFEKDADPKMKIYLRSLAHGTEKVPEPEKSVPFLRFGEFSVSRAELSTLQTDSEKLKNIFVKLEKNARSTKEKFQIIDGILNRKEKGKVRIVLPDQMAYEYCTYIHSLYGHPGSLPLMKLVSKKFYVPGIQELCKNICKQCEICLRTKIAKMPRPSLIEMKSFEISPWNKTFIDLYDLGKPDSKGKRYLVTCVDQLTSYLDGEPISAKTDRLVSEAVLTLILRHGITNKIITDNGRELNGPLSRAILEKFGITHINTSAYMSRANAQVERAHRDITEKLKILDANRKNWSSLWPYCRLMLNNTPKTNLDNLTPCEALFGRPLFAPIDEITPINTGETIPYVKALNQFLTELQPALYKFQVDRHEKLLEKNVGNAKPIKIGTRCLIWKPQVFDGKLSRQWQGPFKVIKKISKHSYILHCPSTRKNFKRNVRHLRVLADKNQPTENTEKIEETIEPDQQNKHRDHESIENEFADYTPLQFLFGKA